MSLKNGTICSKHDSIMELCRKVGSLATEIDSFSDDIYSLTDQAKDDGQRMENGLDSKRKEIDRLEDELKAMEKDRDYWKALYEEAIE